MKLILKYVLMNYLKSYFPNFKFTSIEDGVKETINYFMENENV